MSTNPARAMAAASRLTALLDDPAVGGDLLNVGVALVALVDLHHQGLAQPNSDPHPDGMPAASLRTISDAIETPKRRGIVGMHGTLAREVVWQDRRRYLPPRPGFGAGCEAPMIRRAGYCKRSEGSDFLRLWDWTTGEATAVKYCARHRDWAEDLERRNRADVPSDVPQPYANVGGRLAAHFPEIDWPNVWATLDKTWVAPRERLTPPRPRFELVIGDDECDGGDGAGAPPNGLRLIPSGRVIAP